MVDRVRPLMDQSGQLRGGHSTSQYERRRVVYVELVYIFIGYYLLGGGDVVCMWCLGSGHPVSLLISGSCPLRYSLARGTNNS